MKITSIKQQVKRTDRYSVYVDDKYAFSLSESAMIASRIASGQEISKPRLEELKQLSTDDKLYNRALRYVAMRPRSRWELEFYLQRKNADPPQINTILNKLSELGLLDDKKFAEAFVRDRGTIKPSSRRKLVMELKKKRIAEEIINEAIGDDPDQELSALRQLIERKRRQTKYQDDTKLMQYLARQGFGYNDIKTALHSDDLD